MSFILRNVPPPPPRKKEKEQFPPKTFAVAALAAACLFYYLLCVLPSSAGGESWIAQQAVAVGKLTQAQPLVALLVLALAFLPAVFKRYGVKGYLIRLAALYVILLGGLYIVAERPLERFSAKVEGALHSQRNLGR